MPLRRPLSFPEEGSVKAAAEEGTCKRPLGNPIAAKKNKEALAKERKKEKKLTESQSGRGGARSQRVLGGPTGQHDGDDILGVRPVGGRGPV